MIFCEKCIKNFGSINQYLNHFNKKPHKIKFGARINCPFASCTRFYTLKDSLRKHFITEHVKELEASNVKDCAEVSDLDSLQHSSTYATNVPTQFEQSSSSIDWPALLDVTTSGCSIKSVSERTEKLTSSSTTDPVPSTDSTLTADHLPPIDFMCEIKEKIVHFFGLINSFPAIPFSFLQLITDNMINLCSDVNQIFIKKLSDLRQRLGEDTSKKTLSECIEMYGFINSTFATFKSVYRQIQFFEKEGVYIKPKRVCLRYRIQMRKRSGRYVPTPVKQTSIVVPMREVLSKFLSQENVLDNILKHKEKLELEREYLSNIIQGGCWGNIPKQAGGITLPLALFNDDFEPDNALGGHAGTNKINGSYISIPCLPPQVSSSLSTIFLAMATKASNKKFCGNKRIFKPLIDELKYLHKYGIAIRSSDSKNVKIFFQLAILIGDNLGLNGVGGFVENFSKSKYCCRICYADCDQRKVMKVEVLSLLRTVQKYEDDVMLNDYRQTGIKEECTFNDVPNFHILLNCSVDPMHDVFEGVAKSDILFILKTYIYDYRALTVADLNGRISRFRFGSGDMSNKPPIFGKDCFKKKSFNISASECMCMVKYLGLLIGDLVPPNDPVWQLYIALRRMVDIILSPVLHKDTSHLLKAYVEEHHSIYLNLTQKPLTLKFHNLVHYPGIILKHGPVRHLWCMRFDAKNKVLKSTSNSIASRRNVCLSVAKRNQLQLSFNLFSKKYSQDNLRWGLSTGKFSLGLNSADLTTPVPDCLLREDVVKVSWVEVHGTKYSRGVSLFLDLHEESSLPLFGEILEIYITGSKTIFFVMNNFKTLDFHEKLFAYRIDYSNSRSIFQYEDIHDHRLHSAVPVVGGQLYISLLYNC